MIKRKVVPDSTSDLTLLLKTEISRRQIGWKQSFAMSVLIHSVGFASLVSVSFPTPITSRIQLRQGQIATEAIRFEATVATIELRPEVSVPTEMEALPIHCVEMRPHAAEPERKQLIASDFSLPNLLESIEPQSFIAKTAPMKRSKTEDSIVEIAEQIKFEIPRPKSHDTSTANAPVPIPTVQFSGVAQSKVRIPLSTNEPPKYPMFEIQNGIGGRVVLRITVEPSGSVSAVEIETSSGVEGLDRAAIEAVVRWRFEPLDQFQGSHSEVILAPIAFRIR